MAKTLLEILSKYQPSEKNRAWLALATDIHVFADQDKRALKISAAFPEFIPKSTLYAVEYDIAKAYDLSQVILSPTYPPL